MMDDVESGAAFDRSMLDRIDSMNAEWANLTSQQSSLFGTFSPIFGKFEGLVDSTGYTLENLDNLILKDRSGNLITLTDAQKAQLVDQPKGVLTNLRRQAEGQFNNLVDNIKLYSSHQRVKNAMGKSSGCGELSTHFGSIADLGQRVSGTIVAFKNALDEVKLIKTQIQSEITAFDTNVINLLTGRINGTILSQLVAGSGLHDQIDNILQESGIAHDSTEATQIRTQIGGLLNGNIALTNFFDKKRLVNEVMAKINNERGGIVRQVGEEKGVFNTALTTLRKLGNASAIAGMFKSSECIQTLMGFVGTDSFLNKLGAA